MATFDIWDQATLTDLISKPLQSQFEDGPKLGNLIAPIKSIDGTSAKLRTFQTLAFGKGQFKAPDGNPGLYTPSQTFSESIIELLELEEMHKIPSSEFLQLNSKDSTVARAAGTSLIDRGKALQLRNDRLTEWMRWQAFSGALTVEYPTGSSLYIDYGFQSSQKPVVSTLWSSTSSADPISDMRSFSDTIASLSGFRGLRYHMNSKTFGYLTRNANVKALLTNTNRRLYVPQKEDIVSLLPDGSDIVIYDNGYRAESVGSSRGVPDSLTQFLPDGKVLVTTEYVVDGVNIAETLDGQVVTSGGQSNEAVIKSGPQSEVWFDQMSKNHFLRVAARRVPRLNYPECFVYATVA